MSPSNLASTVRKLEDLPSDGGRAVDTLSGAILRLFVKLAAIERAQALLGRRLDRLEKSSAPVARQGSDPEAATVDLAAARRGRPPGSGKYSGNGTRPRA
jgi:hypothetical protein